MPNNQVFNCETCGFEDGLKVYMSMNRTPFVLILPDSEKNIYRNLPTSLFSSGLFLGGGSSLEAVSESIVELGL